MDKLKKDPDGVEGSFLSNGLRTFINQFGNLLIGLIVMITMRNWYGEEDAGTFLAGFSYAFLLAQIAIFGFDNLSIREIAANVAKNNSKIIEEFHKYSNLFVWTLSILLTVILSLFFFYQNTEETNYYVASIIYVPFFTILLLNQFKLLGLGHVIPAQTPEKLVRPGLLLISMLIIHFFLPDLENLWSLILINLSAFIIVWFISDISFNYKFGIWKKITESENSDLTDELKSEVNKSSRKVWTKSAFGLFIFAIISHLNGKIDIVMLDWMMDNNEDITYYNTAHRFGGFVAFGALIVNQIMGPIVANHYTRNETNALKKIVTKTSLFSFLAALPILLFFYFFGTWMIESLFGRCVPEEQEVLMITSFGYLMQVLAGSATFLLIMKKETSVLASISIALAFLVNIICNVIFIPEYGIIGAAYGTTSALLVWTVLMVIFVWRKIKVNPTFFSKYLFK